MPQPGTIESLQLYNTLSIWGTTASGLDTYIKAWDTGVITNVSPLFFPFLRVTLQSQ